jgi:transcriptional regulator with XRE-family HTH domain
MRTLELTDTNVLVPPTRLGERLSHARREAGTSVESLAVRSHGAFKPADLQLIESGAVALGDDDLRRVAALYGIDLGELSPTRSQLVIDLNEGRVLIGDHTKKFQPGDDDRAIMLRYLALVYQVRNTTPGTPLPARAGDLTVLADVFGTTVDEVHRSLDELMLNAAPELRERFTLLQRRLLIPAVGVLVALTAAGAIVLTSHATAPTPAPARHVNIGTPLVIERDAPGVPSSVANIDDALTLTR